MWHFVQTASERTVLLDVPELQAVDEVHHEGVIFALLQSEPVDVLPNILTDEHRVTGEPLTDTSHTAITQFFFYV